MALREVFGFSWDLSVPEQRVSVLGRASPPHRREGGGRRGVSFPAAPGEGALLPRLRRARTGTSAASPHPGRCPAPPAPGCKGEQSTWAKKAHPFIPYHPPG